MIPIFPGIWNFQIYGIHEDLTNFKIMKNYLTIINSRGFPRHYRQTQPLHMGEHCPPLGPPGDEPELLHTYLIWHYLIHRLLGAKSLLSVIFAASSLHLPKHRSAWNERLTDWTTETDRINTYITYIGRGNGSAVGPMSQSLEGPGSIPCLGRSSLISIEHAELLSSSSLLGLCMASYHGITCALRIGPTEVVTNFRWWQMSNS